MPEGSQILWYCYVSYICAEPLAVVPKAERIGDAEVWTMDGDDYVDGTKSLLHVV